MESIVSPFIASGGRELILLFCSLGFACCLFVFLADYWMDM